MFHQEQTTGCNSNVFFSLKSFRNFFLSNSIWFHSHKILLEQVTMLIFVMSLIHVAHHITLEMVKRAAGSRWFTACIYVWLRWWRCYLTGNAGMVIGLGLYFRFLVGGGVLLATFRFIGRPMVRFLLSIQNGKTVVAYSDRVVKLFWRNWDHATRTISTK